MKNGFFKNLRKIEFSVTNACTGRCKHCSQGAHSGRCLRLDPLIAANTVREVASVFRIETVMVFGGEPLLHRSAVYSIMNVANSLEVPKRQVITNGFFTRNTDEICQVAAQLAECGVNDLLLSVDAFHQETIPINIVKCFAKEVKKCGIPVRISPAWLVGINDDNLYNRQTRLLLDYFCDIDIPVGDGNIVFPEGNALKYLAEYFRGELPKNPYVNDPRDIHCISVSPDGGVLNGNIYSKAIMEIIRDYEP